MRLVQNELCACGCKGALDDDEGIVEEHTTPFALSGVAKPDALFRKPCADKKTFGPRGDITVIAKTKRLRDGRTQADKRKARGSRMKSRGFDKRLRKRMDGSVEPRGK